MTELSTAFTVEIEVSARAETHITDNGMTGVHYQEWSEMDPCTIELREVWMLGRTWTLGQLSAKLGVAGAKAFWEMLETEAEDRDWSEDE
jgi:hypothetical protein